MQGLRDLDCDRNPLFFIQRARWWNRHRVAVQSIKPSIDNKPPLSIRCNMSERIKKSREFQELEKSAEAARGSKVLLSRLFEICQKRDGFHIPGQELRETAVPKLADGEKHVATHVRERMTLVLKENQSIVQRIMNVKPSINLRKSEEDFQHHYVMVRSRNEWTKKKLSMLRQATNLRPIDPTRHIDPQDEKKYTIIRTFSSKEERGLIEESLGLKADEVKQKRIRRIPGYTADGKVAASSAHYVSNSTPQSLNHTGAISLNSSVKMDEKESTSQIPNKRSDLPRKNSEISSKPSSILNVKRESLNSTLSQLGRETQPLVNQPSAKHLRPEALSNGTFGSGLSKKNTIKKDSNKSEAAASLFRSQSEIYPSKLDDDSVEKRISTISRQSSVARQFSKNNFILQPMSASPASKLKPLSPATTNRLKESSNSKKPLKHDSKKNIQSDTSVKNPFDSQKLTQDVKKGNNKLNENKMHDANEKVQISELGESESERNVLERELSPANEDKESLHDLNVQKFEHDAIVDNPLFAEKKETELFENCPPLNAENSFKDDFEESHPSKDGLFENNKQNDILFNNLAPLSSADLKQFEDLDLSNGNIEPSANDDALNMKQEEAIYETSSFENSIQSHDLSPSHEDNHVDTNDFELDAADENEISDYDEDFEGDI